MLDNTDSYIFQFHKSLQAQQKSMSGDKENKKIHVRIIIKNKIVYFKKIIITSKDSMRSSIVIIFVCSISSTNEIGKDPDV
jgi:hypothetical protein